MPLQTIEKKENSTQNNKMEESHLRTLSYIKQLIEALNSILGNDDFSENIDEISRPLTPDTINSHYKSIQEIYIKLESLQVGTIAMDKVTNEKIDEIVNLLIANIRFYMRQAMDLKHIEKNQDFYLFKTYV